MVMKQTIPKKSTIMPIITPKVTTSILYFPTSLSTLFLFFNFCFFENSLFFGALGNRELLIMDGSGTDTKRKVYKVVE
jgi:hypothetical protein